MHIYAALVLLHARCVDLTHVAAAIALHDLCWLRNTVYFESRLQAKAQWENILKLFPIKDGFIVNVDNESDISMIFRQKSYDELGFYHVN